MNSKIKGLVVALITATLAACGGGGGGDSSTATTTPPTSVTPPPSPTPTPVPTPPVIPAPSLYAANTQAVTEPAPGGDAATDALTQTNFYRSLVNLAPLKRSSMLDQAALAHANYMQVNQSYLTEGHNETRINPAFTGIKPGDRTVAAGYTNYYIGENINEGYELFGLYFTDGLVDAPYHRAEQLGPFQDAGSGALNYRNGSPTVQALTVYDIDFGTQKNVGPTDTQLVAYPHSGQSNVPVSWYAAEFPNPVPDLANRYVGYPVELMSMNKTLAVSAFTLADNKGVSISVRLVTKRTDDNSDLRTSAFIVPVAPLAAGLTYTAHAVGTLDGVPFDLSWPFTTVSNSAQVATPSAQSLGSAPGSTLTITVTGLSGRSFAQGISDFATMKTISRGVYQFTRTNAPCSTNCALNLFVGDDTGVTKSYTYPVN